MYLLIGKFLAPFVMFLIVLPVRLTMRHMPEGKLKRLLLTRI